MDGPNRLPPPNPERAAMMRRFDDLPAEARRAISSAAFQFHPGEAERLLRRGATGKRAGEILEAVDHGCYIRTVNW